MLEIRENGRGKVLFSNSYNLNAGCMVGLDQFNSIALNFSDAQFYFHALPLLLRLTLRAALHSYAEALSVPRQASEVELLQI